MIDPPDLSPGCSPWDTNRTNRTRSPGGKYESAHFLTPAQKSKKEIENLKEKAEASVKVVNLYGQLSEQRINIFF